MNSSRTEKHAGVNENRYAVHTMIVELHGRKIAAEWDILKRGEFGKAKDRC